MEIPEYNLKVVKDKTGWKTRNDLIKLVMDMTGHKYWTVRTKTQHLSMDKLGRLFLEADGNPKKFYWLAKNNK